MEHKLFAQSLGKLYLLSNLGYLCTWAGHGSHYLSKQHLAKWHINIIDENFVLTSTSTKAMEGDVCMQKALHKSGWQSLKLGGQKDADSIQKNIGELQHWCYFTA